jgi:hypothetical protein
MSMSAERLLKLFPRAWRERYGDEFLATIGDGPLPPARALDIVRAAIDAWTSSDVREATRSAAAAANRGGAMTLKSILACDAKHLARLSMRDGLMAATIMIAGTLLFTTLAAVARQNGWEATGNVFRDFGFLASMTISMPFWVMKGSPRKLQMAIVGVTLVFLAAIGYYG